MHFIVPRTCKTIFISNSSNKTSLEEAAERSVQSEKRKWEGKGVCLHVLSGPKLKTVLPKGSFKHLEERGKN